MSRLTDPERLDALTRSGLLNRDTAARLDHLAFTACRLLMTDACQINALDGHLQRTVTGYPPGEWPDMPLEDTGCKEVVLTGRPFIVSDSFAHPVACVMPWAEQFRGYLGVPVTFDDLVVGSICVLSFQPRSWKTIDITALEGVSRLVGMSLEGLGASQILSS